MKKQIQTNILVIGSSLALLQLFLQLMKTKILPSLQNSQFNKRKHYITGELGLTGMAGCPLNIYMLWVDQHEHPWNKPYSSTSLMKPWYGDVV